MANTKFDARQSVLRSALGMVGSAANDSLDTIFPKVDAELAKHFEDRNVLLTDGGVITFTGTDIQFTEALNIVINQKISGASPQVISLGSTTVTLTNGQMWYAVIDRTAGTATTSIATSLPAATSANQEVFLIVKRVDAGDGTQRVYWRNGMALNAGQSVRLGASGSGTGGSGTGDDLDALLFRASFNDEFSEGPTDSKSAVDVTAGKTDATAYNAAKGMYTLNYDASKTVTAVGTAVTISSAPAFTVKTGDVIVVPGVDGPKRITAVASQTSVTVESAWTTNPTAAAACISQAIHTKDIYNLAVDGSAISAAFGATTFSEILVDYEDTSTVGDNIYDVNVAPVVAYSASSDGTTFTTSYVRPTNDTDTWTSISLPSAGTALYMRLYANKTSGSGIVNVLRYKAFMQKSVTFGASGGVLNASYAFTNGVGTPVNCSVGVAGGKTTVTLSGYTYAVGVASGSPYGSLDVYLNGQLIPRFIDSTLTPDASYLETSPSVITLDKDYSFQNISIEILQRVQIVDASTTNTTSISAIQDMSTSAWQAFVSQNTLMSPTASTGSPVAGTFYSTVVNRASIPDLSQDLKPRMGVERLQFQTIQSIQNEFGPNGEPVYGVTNDTDNKIRLVGQWVSAPSSAGTGVNTNAAGDFMEITFYGTGLNALIFSDANARDIRASVDGGSEGSNLYPTGPTIWQRNYSPNIVVNAASNLALGIHTVKLRVNSAAFNNVEYYGVEILNESSSVKVNPGVSFVNGKKLVSALQSSFSYSAPVTGTRGGRVLVYHKADGTIAQAFQAVNGSSAALASADHTNEEVVRTYFWREFGAGRTDDFSATVSTAGSFAFTLDDGTTSLAGSGVRAFTANATESLLPAQANGSFISFTFVGTGCDYIRNDTASGGADTFTLTVDGVSQGTIASTGTGKKFVQKLISGLPYGTHVLKITRTSAPSTYDPGLVAFLVYQPKKPTLPAGSVELADYNVMATFAANTTAGLETVSTGVARKVCAREITYVDGTGGTSAWTLGSTDPSNFLSGFQARTDKLNAFFQYAAFCTGFDLRYQGAANRSSNIAVTVNGLTLNTTNFPSLVTSVYGGGSFNTSTGILAQSTSATNGCGFTVTGLPLGINTIKFNNGTASVFLNVESLDPITPIHSNKSNLFADFQNTLPVGSNGISDNRKTTPIKDNLSGTKAWAVASGIATATTTSTSYIPLTDMSLTLKTGNGGLDISFNASGNNSGAGGFNDYTIFVDGIQVGQNIILQSSTANNNGIVSMRLLTPVTAGTHKIDIYWKVSANTGSSPVDSNGGRTLTVREI